jgi:vacuolar protein sorting-associated protein 13A/C
MRHDTIASASEAFEAITEEVAPTLILSVEFVGIGISLINRKLVEVVYISMDAPKFQYTDSAIAQTVNLSCGTLQIDNQLHEALYPVILQPTPIVKKSNVAALPTVQGSVIWLKDEGQLTVNGPRQDHNNASVRAWGPLRQVLLDIAAGFDHRDRRGPSICYL